MKIFVPFKETKRQWAGDPKYTFHIKQACANCHKFQKFLKQDEKLMAELKGCVLMQLDTEARELPLK